MKFRKIILMFASFAIITCMLSSCLMALALNKNKKNLEEKITVENGIIPPNYKKEAGTLLVVKKGRKSYDKYLIKAFKEYKGDYVIADASEIDGSKYIDKEKYKFIFDSRQIGIEKTYTDDSKSYHEVPQFFMVNRKSNQNYLLKDVNGAFADIMEIYVKKLNIELGK